ncbi:MAG TPA: glycosyltransferase family 87 protein [Aromatoleum sp.]|uniref:glycosyltransferase family 87 protein n=1 Tax=Aromatoleum sp. TaxID=2307007 RepID=UPI002B48E3CA|nr:glycosyltransferase family 87 protein [Aromatoleum sp.]HJV25436.1 glycosyltransferase family 87 protein [Aromatoleum sp.]
MRFPLLDGTHCDHCDHTAIIPPSEVTPARMEKSHLAVTALWMVAAAYAVFIGWTLVSGYRAATRGEMPLYTDYTPTYAASILVSEIPAENLYRPKYMAEAGRRAAVAAYPGITPEQARGVGFAPWMYPPTFILLVAPLAAMPYLLSWFAWIGLTAVPYLAAMRRILPSALAWPFALAAPPVFFNVMYGQTGFLTGGLIGLGLTLLAAHPLVAGILIGLASVKPHFGILVPIALAAGGHWRTFAAASITVLSTVAASAIAFGDDPWFAFIGTSLFHLEGFGAGAYNFIPMTTVLATLRMAGLPLHAAWDAQYASATLMVAIVAWVWWRGRRRADTLGLQSAILCTATPLAIPMTYLYDLVLLVPAAGWIWADMMQRGAGRDEKLILLIAMAALLAVKYVAATFGLQTGALFTAALLFLALRRFRATIDARHPE